jgi:hypothetical protein
MQVMRYTVLFIGVMAGAAILLAACSAKEEKKPVATNSHEQGIKKQTTVVDPPVSKGKWRAVVVGVTDKQTGKETAYEVPIGSQASISNSGITISVETFLPDFTMQGTLLTSKSNEPKNPAAKIRVFEGDKEIFKGWLFALYPTTHSFQHPRYGFTLKNYIPAQY